MTSEYPATGELAGHPTGAEHAVLLRGVLLYGEGEKQDVLIQDGVIAEIGADLADSAPQGAEVLDLDGQVLLPGLVDMHVHLREPGREDTETIATGSAAAAQGGFTAVFTMANTAPSPTTPPSRRWCGSRARTRTCAMCTRSARSPRGWRARSSRNSA